MIKSELIQQIAERNPHLDKRDIERVVANILDTISDALARGDKVELRGFGAFSVKKHAARIGRNPRTGESVELPSAGRVTFTPGSALKTAATGLSGGGDDTDDPGPGIKG
jgi:integration host factor subunit beta